MKENKNMNNEAANNNFNNNEGGIVMMTGTMTMDVFAGTVIQSFWCRMSSLRRIFRNR